MGSKMNVKDLNISSVKYSFLAYGRQEAVIRITNDIKFGHDWRALIRWAAQRFPDISVVHVEHAKNPHRDYHFELDIHTQEWNRISPKYIRFAGEWLDMSHCLIESIGRIDGEDSRHG